jgi:hypothetical protein
MNIKTISINDLKSNPNNPRIIKDDKFKKLVESVKSFPEMLSIRPVVCNADMIVLGGNMRFAACKEVGIKELPVIIADNLTEEQQREFIIKDNVSGGEWDWDVLANDWDAAMLVEWGLDMGGFEKSGSFFEDENTDYDSDRIVIKMSVPPSIWLDMQTKIKNEIDVVSQKYGIEITWPK